MNESVESDFLESSMVFVQGEHRNSSRDFFMLERKACNRPTNTLKMLHSTVRLSQLISTSQPSVRGCSLRLVSTAATKSKTSYPLTSVRT